MAVIGRFRCTFTYRFAVAAVGTATLTLTFPQTWVLGRHMRVMLIPPLRNWNSRLTRWRNQVFNRNGCIPYFLALARQRCCLQLISPASLNGRAGGLALMTPHKLLLKLTPIR